MTLVDLAMHPNAPPSLNALQPSAFVSPSGMLTPVLRPEIVYRLWKLHAESPRAQRTLNVLYKLLLDNSPNTTHVAHIRWKWLSMYTPMITWVWNRCVSRPLTVSFLSWHPYRLPDSVAQACERHYFLRSGVPSYEAARDAAVSARASLDDRPHEGFSLHTALLALEEHS
jgi:hypothetical protein